MADAAASGAPAPSGAVDLFSLRGKVAVVTGGAGGIGAAAARTLARHGAAVVLFDSSAERLASTERTLLEAGATATAIHGDITEPGDVERLADAVAGGADILVNSAGRQRRGPVTELGVDDLDWLWEVNVRGLFRVTQALVPAMIERGGGKIINLGSLGSVLGLEQRTAYALTKGAVRQYTQSLAAELGIHGICVNAIAPGYVETAMTSDLLADAGTRERLLSRIVLGRFGRTEDLAGVFAFLASSASDYVTGQIIVVDGGWTSW
jgi:NAD(P)-dependent dehydrogenase (short-subunit alcohol dehydrogenase family)